MSKIIWIFNWITHDVDDHFFSDLEDKIWYWNRCFNCDKCWDIITESWNVKDAVIDCLWKQSWINNVKIFESCNGHTLLDNYAELRKWD